MPPSSQLILDLLAKSVAKLNSQGGKREIRDEAGEGCNTHCMKKSMIEKYESEESPMNPDEMESNEDLTRSLVYTVQSLEESGPKTGR